MKRLQAYKFELKTNERHCRELGRIGGCSRFVWNKALALQEALYASGEKKLGYTDLCKLLTGWRADAETPWLAEAPCHPLQQTLKNLESAYKNFFEKRADKPVFKKKGKSRDSFRYPDPKQFKVDQANSRIFLPKIGWVGYRASRLIEGAPKNITVSRTAGRWFVSVQTEREVAQPAHPSPSMVGVDVGVAVLATLSDGTAFAPANSLRSHERKLARAQRRLSRKHRFSRNWQKQKRRIARLHWRIANVRKDALHKTTTAISKNHAMVVIEDLAVGSMSRSARGTAEEPGRNVQAKAGLNKSILDQGWGEFRRQLEYKQAWRGGDVLAINPRHTSQTCSECGHVSSDNRRSQARFACVACGHEANADLNAACNILAAGHAVIACGEKAVGPLCEAGIHCVGSADLCAP
jgi:putative transposase